MNTQIPEEESRFAELVVQQGYLSAEQVHDAVEKYRGQVAAGDTEKPTVAKVLISEGLLLRSLAEALVRHIKSGEPLPPPIRRSAPRAAEPQPDEHHAERKAMLAGMGAL